jgi:hypothetical protein
MSNHRNEGLDDRSRDKDGEIRRKREDTRVDTLRETYPGFAPGYRGDSHLGTVLENERCDSLTEYLRRLHNKQ